MAKAFLRKRPATALLVLQRSEILHDPAAAASQIGDFLGSPLATSKMAAEVDPSLYRQHGLRER
ncbi:MAG: hypothetical protein ABSG03_11500 [Bryobacteraceae bacterium]